MDDCNVLALYGFRSKQEFIYRTNKMREITGASELIAGLFDVFIENTKLGLDAKWKDDDDNTLPWKGLPEGRDGIVVYEGGGNLCILFRNKETYISANKEFSRMVLKEAPGLGLIAAYVPATEDFRNDLAELHRAHDVAKNTGANTEFCNTLPYTQIDRTSFQPIVEKRSNDHKGIAELTAASAKKLDAYVERADKNKSWKNEGMYIDELVDDKGRDSLIAVIYCDGNSIGSKLKELGTGADSSYPGQIERMREFSIEVHKALVEKPLASIHEALDRKYGTDPARTQFRTVIDHGDEITLIANAHVALDMIGAYFKAVEESGYTACAGVAVCHSHDPFSEVYKIAEECCESGKKKNRSVILEGGTDASYLDFHFCRSGITGTLEQIRAAQESAHTARPYAYGNTDALSLSDLQKAGELLKKSKVSRGDIKNLGDLIISSPLPQENDSRFRLEIERLKFKEDGEKNLEAIEQLAKGQFRQLLFDISSFYDVWFDD